MPFAEGRGLVAVILQDFRNRRGSHRHDAGVARHHQAALNRTHFVFMVRFQFLPIGNPRSTGGVVGGEWGLVVVIARDGQIQISADVKGRVMKRRDMAT